MKKSSNYELFSVLFPVVILPISTTIISILINRINQNIGIVSIIISIVCIFCVLLLLCVSANLFLKRLAADIIKNSTTSIALEVIKMYEEKQKFSRTFSDELFSLRDIYDIENTRCFQGKQLLRVDVVASSFNYDTSDEYRMKNKFRDVVVQNSDKDVEYNFYITDTPENIIYIKDLNNQCKNKLNINIIDERYFHLLMKDFDFSIYHLKSDNNFTERIGFMSLSNIFINNEVNDLFHVKMADAQVKSMISMLPDSVTRKVINE